MRCVGALLRLCPTTALTAAITTPAMARIRTVGHAAASVYVCAECHPRQQRRGVATLAAGWTRRRLGRAVMTTSTAKQDAKDWNRNPYEPGDRTPPPTDPEGPWRLGHATREDALAGLPLPPELERKDPATYERLLRESDFTSAGTKLVDTPENANDYALWTALLLFRRRVYGHAGVRLVWSGLQTRSVRLPTTGPYADTMWRTFLATAYADPTTDPLSSSGALLDELWKHAQVLLPAQWVGLYDGILFPTLVHTPVRALEWHARLHPTFTSPDWTALFVSVLAQMKQPRAQYMLRALHHTLPGNPGVCVPVLSHLVATGRYTDAARWQRHFLRDGRDVPPTSSADPLLAWTSRHRLRSDLMVAVARHTRAGVPLDEATAVAIVRGRRGRVKEALEIVMAYPAFPLHDAFWAALLAGPEQELPTQEALELLVQRATNDPAMEIGEATIAGLIRRLDASRLRVLSLLAELSVRVRAESKIRHLESTINTVPEGDAASSDGIVGTEIRRLLSHALGLATPSPISTSPSPPSPPLQPTPESSLETLLRAHLQHERLSAALATLSDHLSQPSPPPLSPNTVRQLVKALLAPRRPGHRSPTVPPLVGSENTRLPDTLAIQLLLRLGRQVPAALWREPLIRLGKAGHMRRLRQAAEVLLRIYPPMLGAARCDAHTVWGHDLIKALVVWGFISSVPRPLPPPAGNSNNLSLRQRQKHSAAVIRDDSDPDRALVAGVRLAAHLRDAGVHVDARSVARGVALGVRARWGLFVPEATAAAGNLREIDAAVRCCEDAWGARLFKREGDDSVGKGKGKIRLPQGIKGRTVLKWRERMLFGELGPPRGAGRGGRGGSGEWAGGRWRVGLREGARFVREGARSRVRMRGEESEADHEVPKDVKKEKEETQVEKKMKLWRVEDVPWPEEWPQQEHHFKWWSVREWSASSEAGGPTPHRIPRKGDLQVQKDVQVQEKEQEQEAGWSAGAWGGTWRLSSSSAGSGDSQEKLRKKQLRRRRGKKEKDGKKDMDDRSAASLVEWNTGAWDGKWR